MKKWEYKQTTDFEKLEKLGLEGWELVSAICDSWRLGSNASGSYNTDGRCDRVLYVLKRPINEV